MQVFSDKTKNGDQSFWYNWFKKCPSIFESENHKTRISHDYFNLLSIVQTSEPRILGFPKLFSNK